MSQVEQIMARHHAIHELDGITYRCHKMTAQLALEAFGPGALMVVAEEDGTHKVNIDRVRVGSGAELMKKVLAVAMISPRLGPRDDPGDDVVSWLTLADHGPRLYSLIMEGESERAANFPESSEARPGP